MADGQYFYRRGVGYLLEVTPRWGLALELCHFEDHACLHFMPVFGNFFVRLPALFWREVPSGEMMAQWGFSWPWSSDERGRDLFLHWGAVCKIVHMPWDLVFIRRSVLMADGSWLPMGRRFADPPLSRFQATYDYTYAMQSGEKQHRQATVTVDEMEWRQKWLRWCPWLARVRRYINVTLSEPVGERVGSWKGGTTGCGYELRRGETPLACLRRMELERKFR